MEQEAEAIVVLYLARIYKYLPRVLHSLAMPQLALVQDYIWHGVWFGSEFRKDVRIRIALLVPGLLGCIVHREPQVLEPVWLCSDVWLNTIPWSRRNTTAYSLSMISPLTRARIAFRRGFECMAMG